MNTPKIRAIARCDLRQIIEIERQSFTNHAWDFDDLHDLLWNSVGTNVCGWVSHFDSEVVGYCVFAVLPYHFDLINFAVAKEYRGCGIGRNLVERLVAKMHSDRKGQITCLVPETNLQAHLVLRALGFRASKVLHRCYLTSNDDGYLFALKASSRIPTESPCQPTA